MRPNFPVFSAGRRPGLICVLAGMLATPVFAVVPWTLLINTNNILVVTNVSYGAVGDGVATNTTALQNAINAAALGGTVSGLSGGTVEIPPGIYLSGPLTLKSSVNLQIDAGAILRMLPLGMYPGGTNLGTTFISGSSLHDIEISGSGAVDGQGAAWWPYASVAGANRPRMLSPSSCNRLLIQNVTLSNSPMFHIAISGGGNTTVQGVTVYAPSTGPNTDACDVSGTNIVVQNCHISVGDDDYTCGGGTHDVLLTNNVYGTGHGVSIGSYTDSGGVSNITVINCTFDGTDNGIRLKSERGRGGLVQNLNYQNLSMTNVSWPLLVYSCYEFGLGTLTGVNPWFAANTAATNPTTLNSLTPIWRNITFSNITATMPSGRPPLMVWGLPEALASNIVFRSVNITSASTLPPEIFNATNIQFIDCTFSLPTGVKTAQFWNANVTFTNSSPLTNLLVLDGLTTNGLGNSLSFYNARATLANTNALDDGPLTLSASTFTVSNSLTLAPTTVLNLFPGTSPTRLAVVGNLTLGGTNNIFAGADFTNGSYPLMSYTGTLNGSLPVLDSVPAGYNYAFDTSASGLVKLVVTLPAPFAPTNLVATPTNLQINLKWNAVNGAASYNLKRGMASGTYPTIISGLIATNYSDAIVTNAVNYFYVVSAVGAGGEGSNSLPVTAAPLPSNQPTNLVLQAGGGQLQLSWPADHLGWRLQIQTNSLSTGLSTTNWATMPNSTNMISATVPINPTAGAVFLRLVYP